VRFFNAPSARIAELGPLFAANLLLVYTQYYGWLVVGGEALALLLWSRGKLVPFGLSAALLALCFAPWAYLVTRVALGRGGLEPNIGSFARPDLMDDVKEFYTLLTGPLSPGWLTRLSLVGVCGSLLLAAWRAIREGGIRAEGGGWPLVLWWLGVFATLPTAASYLASQVYPQSVWGTRFLIVVAPAYLLLMALAALWLRPWWARAPIVLLIVGCAGLSGYQSLRDQGRNAWEPLAYQMAQAETAAGPGITVYAFGSMDETIAFYLAERGERRFRTRRVQDEAELQGDHFWVALHEPSGRAAIQALARRGYQLGEGFRDGYGGLLFPAWRT
jgi:hypothetical protein